MEIFITLPGSIKSKKNSKRIYACGRFKRVLPSKAYEAWEKEARRCAKPEGRDVRPLTCPVSVTANIFYKGPKPDLSGCLESIGDALEGVIWEDDGQIISWDGSRLIHDKDNPRTEVIVRWT
jgi:Holliday junction resolvase RusA-like endonuclease